MRLPLLLLASLLLGFAARAQQPTQLPSAPAVPPAGTPAVAAPASDDLVPGHQYEVKLRSGVGFTGRLVSVQGSTLTFEAPGLGMLTAERSNIATLSHLGAPGRRLRPERFDIGSGSRYYFGPSARNLRRGEGVAHDALLFVAGANYGITDNFSLGGYVTLIPGVGVQNQVIMFTPKVSFEVGGNWQVGAGAIGGRIIDFDEDQGYGAGILYGLVSHGTADSNFTLGVGYGYAGHDVGSTPTLYLAGQHRISPRISLMSENYIIAASEPAYFGLYGIKVHWPRVSLGIGSGYAGYSSSFFFGYVYPVYYDVSFRFGKPYQSAGRP